MLKIVLKRFPVKVDKTTSSLLSTLRDGIMSKTHRIKPESSPNRKTDLSSDAKIIVALIKNQPLTKEELCKAAKISDSSFYRNVPLLEEEKTIKCVDDMYSLFDYDSLEKKIEDALIKIIREKKIVFPRFVENEIGKPWHEIEAMTYKVAHKIGLTMGETDRGETTFYDKKMLTQS